MPREPSEKLKALRSTYLDVVRLGEAVLARESLSPAEPPPSAAFDWQELGASCTRIASLKQLMRDYLTSWNEGVGAAVEAFWREVAEQGLEIERTHDVVAETIRRGRILNPPQFYELEDHFEELQECGKVSPEEADALNAMLDAFESNPKSFEWVSSR